MIQELARKWKIFWFAPSSPASLTTIRRALGVITALYFVSAFGDVETWFVAGAPASSTNLSAFFRAAELGSEARWMISPLFLWDSLFAGTSLAESSLVYRGYLLIGITLALLVGLSDALWRSDRVPSWAGRFVGGSGPALLLWLWMIGWANRAVLLAGIVEPLLSVSLAALAIAPVAGAKGNPPLGPVLTWRATLSRRLIAVQTTLIALLSTATMLASPTWWNGTGAYALVAASEDRFFSATGTLFETPVIYESTTLLIVLFLPLGVFLAWRRSSRRLGLALIWIWCVVVALLSAHVLYAATLATVSCSLGGSPGDPGGPNSETD